MMERPINIILLGLSGSGKGTQVELLLAFLKPRYRMQVIATGDLFRTLKSLDTDVGARIRDTLAKGGLAFDDLATTLWMHEIAVRVKEDEGIVLDGAPRRVPEAENLDRFLEYLERRERTYVLYLRVSPEEATKRLLLRGREDDTNVAIAARMAYFRDRVMPVIFYYRDQERLLEINGEQSIESVHKDIVKALRV